jgi:hypothetical protein
MALGARRLFAALVLAGAASTFADEPDYGRFQLGPFYLTPKVLLTRYDGVNTAGYGAPVDPLADSTTVLIPSLDTVVPFGRRLRFKGRGLGYLSPFREKDDPRVMGYSGWGGAEIDLGPLSAFGSLGWGRSKERVSFELRDRVQRNETSKTAGVSLRLGERLTTSATRIYRDWVYDKSARVDGANVGARLDRDSVVDRYDARCALSRLTTLVVSADVIDDRFLVDGLPVRSYRYLGGFTFKPLAFVQGSVMAGYRRLAPGQGVASYEGSTFAGALTMALFRFGDVTQTADRDVTFSLSATRPGERSTVLVTRYRTSLHLQMPLSLIAAPYYANEQPRDLNPGAKVAGRTERLGGSLFRAFGRSLRLGGGVETVRTRGSSVRPTSYFATAEWTP